MRFEWDEAKSRRNRLKHAVGFETAALAFDDPYALTQRDESTSEEERWITPGSVNSGKVLFVVHTWRARGEEEVIRIISARRATPRERKGYEEGNQRTKAGYRRRRGHERRGY
jgi:uncharacterized DUF497 family protein